MKIDRDIEYWNAIAGECFPDGTNLVVANFYKPAKLMRKILDYDYLDKTILEVGTGFGIVAFVLNVLYGRKLIKYIGTDISDKFREACKKYHAIDVIHAPADDLPADDGTVDYIFAFDVIEHINPIYRDNVAKEFKRILKPGSGRLFINNPLSESKHDSEFEFYFSMEDLSKLATSMDGIVERITVYEAGKRYFQFISIVSGQCP